MLNLPLLACHSLTKKNFSLHIHPPTDLRALASFIMRRQICTWKMMGPPGSQMLSAGCDKSWSIRQWCGGAPPSANSELLCTVIWSLDWLKNGFFAPLRKQLMVVTRWPCLDPPLAMPLGEHWCIIKNIKACSLSGFARVYSTFCAFPELQYKHKVILSVLTRQDSPDNELYYCSLDKCILLENNA